MQIPDGFGQANFRFTGAAVPSGAEVTLGFDISGYSGSAANAAEDAGQAWADNISNTQVVNCDLTSTLFKFGPNDVGPSAEVLTSGPGIKNNPSVTPNTGVLVQKITNFGGRTGRGRMFIPGIRETSVSDGGLIDPTELTDWQTALDLFFSDLNTFLLVPCLLHAEGSPVSTPRLITSFSVQATVATQRRRLRR
jgi:hypothetical protein